MDTKNAVVGSERLKVDVNKSITRVTKWKCSMAKDQETVVDLTGSLEEANKGMEDVAYEKNGLQAHL